MFRRCRSVSSILDIMNMHFVFFQLTMNKEFNSTAVDS